MVDRDVVAADGDCLELGTWLRLLACCTLLEKEIRTRLRDFGRLTLPQFHLLAVLEDADDGGLVMGELSRRLMVTNGNITALVDRLVRDGFLDRRVSPNDRRALVVRMTPQGHAAYDAVAPAYARWLQEIMAAVPPEQVEELYLRLGDLKAHLSAS